MKHEGVSHLNRQGEEFNKLTLNQPAPSDYLLIRRSDKGNLSPCRTGCEVPRQIIAQFRAQFGNSNFRKIPTPPLSRPSIRKFYVPHEFRVINFGRPSRAS